MKLSVEGVLSPRQLELLHRVARAAQSTEGVAVHCLVQLKLCDDDQMRHYNRSLRGKDSSTDVLSFPSICYPAGQTAGQAQPLLLQEWDVEEAACLLGDILISLPHAEAQAQAYGHSLDRELSYLLVHGIFHLFGYDHVHREEKQLMRQQEEKALQLAGQSPASDAEMITRARQALQHAYAPYSNFRVGACVMTKDGRLFTGCNVENASYGLTNCAERTAMFKAISEGAGEPIAIAIAARADAPWPCGACRQVLSEFAADMRILLTWGEDGFAETSLLELLPHSFSPANGMQETLRRAKND